MTKGQHIKVPYGRKAVQGTALGVCLALSGIAFAASAQNAHEEQPVIVTTAPDTETAKPLPKDLQPETLQSTKAHTINPKDIKRSHKRRNRWDPQTLTQPTGLSAATSRANTSPSSLGGPRVEAKVLPTDILSTEDLLAVNDTALAPINLASDDAAQIDGVINFSSSLRGALFGLPTIDSDNASVFKLDLGGVPCLGAAEECQLSATRRIDVAYSKDITHGKMDGFNLQLTPRGRLHVDDDGKSALVGALVRIGDNLREDADMKSNTWYFFAGADAEALTYTPNSVRRLTSGDFHLQDRIIVGDAQAGLGYRLGDADLSLTYFKRQATAENYSFNEDAAALSITWKR